MIKFIKSLYFPTRFFLILLGFVFIFVVSQFVTPLFVLLKFAFGGFLLLFLFDVILLYKNKNGIIAEQLLPEKFSNGDNNPVHISFNNLYAFPLKINAIDEIPHQFQIRDFHFSVKLKSGEEKDYVYNIRPTKRGVYQFGNLNVYAETFLGLMCRKYVFSEGKDIAVYPSFLQLHKYDFLAIHSHLTDYGVKKIRRLGQTMEFEQIKDYVSGDDIRNINWKATAKRGKLMVNQYQDERAQHIFCVIDKGRVMKMPFNELSLLDYSVNSALVMSNVALQKNDKAGLFTFSRKVENRVLPKRSNAQMQTILETLYKIETDFAESDFERLYADIRRNIAQRSLLLLFTNFENINSMQRQLPYLKAVAKNHLLVVIIFKNVELHKLIYGKAVSTREIYHKVIAEKFNFDKKLIVNELNRYGIQTILTEPENLTINTINKYLELKAKGAV
ncbi:MAG: DUF58 domain-containing protein [Prevotellaceae bacterium]|jgi:uncharacterized protein (DUF58 family)|nr:DUF58 domain-containing protein [Prevotellaceae bacterium]